MQQASFGLLLTLYSACCAEPINPNESPACRDAFAASTAALLWPGARHSFLVNARGDIDNGDWVIRFDLHADGRSADMPRAICYADKIIPIAEWSRIAGDISWSFEAVAVPAGWDTSAVVSCEVTVRNGGGTPKRIAFEATIDSSAGHRTYVAPAASMVVQVLRWGPTAGKRVVGTVSIPAQGMTARGEWNLLPGEDRRIRLVLAATPTLDSKLHEWTEASHRECLAFARKRWQEWLSQGIALSLGDERVESAFESALVVLLGCTERHADYLIPIGNPFQYRDVWLRDGARCIAALAMAGYSQTARDLASSFLAYQWPQGPFLSQRGQLDGTGQALWAWEQAFLRPGPAPEVKPFATAALAAWRWMESQRASTTMLQLPFGGLMPYAEPRDGELPLGRAQLVGNDAWAIAGYRSAARLLMACNMIGEAREVDRSRLRYAAVFEEALDRTGRDDIPPVWGGEGRDWGNLQVTYPCFALAALHPRNLALMRRLDRQDSGAHLVHYGRGDTLHTYLSADIAAWALLAGRPSLTWTILDDLIRWRTASGGSPEMFDAASRDYGANLPPHATAAAAIVTLIRSALVFDDCDSLLLTAAAREEWWRSGGTVRRAPTRWGWIDLRFSMSKDEAIWSWTPVTVPTVLSVPPGTRVLGVADPLRILDSQHVIAPSGVKEARVRIDRGRD